MLESNDSRRDYSTFIFALLAEFDSDINKVLRVLNIGVNSRRRIVPSGLYKFLILSIKEAIVLSNYEKYIEDDGFISVISMAKSERFILAHIDRQTILRTLKKYDIEYTKRK